MPETPDICPRRLDVSDRQKVVRLHRRAGPLREGSGLANRKLRWVYLDANWSF